MRAPGKRTGKRAVAEQQPVQDATPESLTRTLEDLEARLNRLSVAQREIEPEAPAGLEPEAPKAATLSDHPAETSTAARLRAVIEQRLAGASRLAPETSGSTEGTEAALDRRRRASAALDRRFGTIAGEVEALRIQGTTFQLVSTIADELQALKTEIAGNIAARSESGFDEIRQSFEALRAAVSAKGGTGDADGQVAAILERLSDIQEKGADRASLDHLRRDFDEIVKLLSQSAREETVAANGRRWDAFEARLEAHIELDGAARRDLGVELERLRQTVRSLATDEQVRAVEGRWDEFEQRFFDKLRTETDETLGARMRGELEALGARIDAMAAASSTSDIDARLARMEEAGASVAVEAALARLSERFGQLEEALVDMPNLFGIERLDQRIQMLSESVALVAEQQLDPDLEHFILLEERLDEISQAIVASALREDAPFDMAPIERIEARVADLSMRVERLAAQNDPPGLSERIAGLADRIEQLAAAPPAPETADAGLQALAERIDAALLRIERPEVETAAFEERLSALAARLEDASAARVDEDIVRSLETQIARLASLLAEGPSVVHAGMEPDTHRRLSAVEQRLDENRAEVMTAARTAADEAVRLMLQEGARRESEHVRNLSQDLQSLEVLCRETDQRSLQIFDAVHATLVKIADRLVAIEGEVRNGHGPDAASGRTSPAPLFTMPELDAVAAERVAEPDASRDFEPTVERAPPRGLRAAIARHLGGRSGKAERDASQALADAVALRPAPTDEIVAEKSAERVELSDAPSLDASDSIFSREVNRPLEPGSGAPDIASLLERVRLQQSGENEIREPIAKADFIAAARKAALAAAAEADSLRREASDADDDGNVLAEGRLGRHRKPILMAVGAVLLAMMAMPLGRSYLENESGEVVEMARIAAPSTPSETTAPAAAPVAEPETVPVVEPEPAPEAVAAPIVPIPAEPEAVAIAEPAQAVTPATPAEPSRLEASLPAAPEPNSGESIAALAAARAVPGYVDTAIETASLVSQPSMSAPQPERPAAAIEATPAEDAVETAEAAPIMAIDPEAEPVLARAVSGLPDAARAELPRPPSAIGPTALVAASDGGDPKAIFEIGLRLMEGRGSEPKPAEAFVWFAHSGRLGYAPAQYSLGTLFEKGNGVERNTGAARDWYTLAAEQGNVRAMHNLAVLYATGVDGQSEPETAAQWFTEAARHGMRDSQYNLGILHARGAGVEQDLGESYRWFSIVGATGDRDANEKRDEVAKTLEPEEIASLDAEVAEWKPLPRIEAANSVDIPPAWSEGGDETASVDMRRAVRNVQAILIKLGFDPGTPDGIVGTRTTDAVRAFQEQNGLATTGSIDETLIRELLKQNV